MKKLFNFVLLLFISLTILTSAFSTSSFAAGFEDSGEYKRYKKDNGDYAYSEFVEDNKKIYYINENGYKTVKSWVVINDDFYYAASDGEIYRDGPHLIDENTFYFDIEGKLVKGWINDIYYANEDGYLVDGFQQLEVPKDWYKSEIDSNKEEAWFYFNPSSHKKVYAEYDEYVTKTIGNAKYCFDANGMLCTGWRKVKDDEDVVMKGYMYFVEEKIDDFKFGEALYNTWYTTEPPEEVLPNGQVEFFYFGPNGQPRCANQEGGYLKVRIGTKTYLFNEYGYTVHGIRKIGNDYYYFGPSEKDCSMKTGMQTQLDGLGNTLHYYFTDDGVGYTGIHNNKLYYKGLLQKASSVNKYEAFNVQGIERLVNSEGLIMKNKKKVKDANGVVWSTNASGVVIYTDEGVAQDPEAPEPEDDVH